MAWACPQCGKLNNNDSEAKCTCGYNIDDMNKTVRYQPMEKHSYPILIKLIGLTIFGLFLYSILFIPKYFSASSYLKKGERYLSQHQYNAAISAYKNVLEIIPSSKRAKISIAIAYFSNDDSADDIEGMRNLEGITIEDSDWKKLSNVMPSEYKQYFTTVKR